MATEDLKQQDTRIRKDPATDMRAARGVTADVERTEDSVGNTPEQLAALLRDEFKQEALPTAPEIPGYHVCWLASNNTWDPLYKRMRLGYTPVMVDEMPSMASFRMTSGEFSGVVSCNEMLLFKIPLDAYAQIMREYHHDAPLREEESLRAQLRRGATDSRGKDLESIEGFEDLAVRRSVPNFA